ncbi:MAG: WhiB family transcriptional regulator [Acidimicrobiaceae bacterium]|nr:WhiB family transcriptional regulator [Acidimicrobiaceae bacterium]
MDRAIAICLTCPVKQECLDYAVRYNEKYLVWGGMTPTQRDSYRKGHPVPVRRPRVRISV